MTPEDIEALNTGHQEIASELPGRPSLNAAVRSMQGRGLENAGMRSNAGMQNTAMRPSEAAQGNLQRAVLARDLSKKTGQLITSAALPPEFSVPDFWSCRLCGKHCDMDAQSRIAQNPWRNHREQTQHVCTSCLGALPKQPWWLPLAKFLVR